MFKYYRERKIFAAALAVVAITLSPLSLASEKYAKKNEQYTQSLYTLSKTLSKKFEKDIILNQDQGKIDISLANENQNIDYSDFLSILYANHLTAVEGPQHIQIIHKKEIRSASLPTIKSGEPHKEYPEYQFVTGFIKFDKLCAPQFLPIVRPMASQSAHMAAYHPTNSMVISDTYGNFKRLEKVINYFEQNASEVGKACGHPHMSKLPRRQHEIKKEK